VRVQTNPDRNDSLAAGANAVAAPSPVGVAPRRRLGVAERERQILDGAIQFFAERGFAGQLRDLARSIGVTHALLYHYFPTKQALIDRVYREVFEGRWNPAWEAMLDDPKLNCAISTWGERVGVEVIRGAEGSDPASVAFEAVKEGMVHGVDTVVVDTAGRLQNKAGLMDELGKVKRVIEKLAPVTEVLLVLDATTGQNGLVQAKVFSEVVDVTGIVLTKLDGSAKGGIVMAVQQQLGVPVKLVGLGEGPDDLAPFDAGAFVDALLG